MIKEVHSMQSHTDSVPSIILLVLSNLAILGISLLAYRLKTVRKIDNFLLSRGIEKDRFDGLWGRYTFYAWAILFPKSFKEIFVKKNKNKNFFDPYSLGLVVTKSDKAIIILLFSSFFIFLTTVFI